MNTITSYPLSLIVDTIRTKASKIQEECLKVREELFYDPERGFDHNIGGLRTSASVKRAEARIDNLTGGLVRFKFRSHRLLWFSIQGIEKRFVIDCANKYNYYLKDSNETNPYMAIERALLNSASELVKIRQAYNNLLMAA